MKRPIAGTPEHREWLVRCVHEACRRCGISLESITRHHVDNCKDVTDAYWPHYEDWQKYGNWKVFKAELLLAERRVAPATAVAHVRPEAPAAAAPDALETRRLKSALEAAKAESRSLLDRLDVAERAAAHASSLASDPRPAGIQRRERVFGKREATAVALASDWHVEEIVEPDKVNDLNAFDLSIAERSAQRFFEGVLWLIESHSQAFAIRDLVLWLGGDLFTGHIHEDNVESTAFSPLFATRFVRELVTRGIRMLLEESELVQITIPCNRGNHGRSTRKPRVSTGAEHSYEQALYYQLADDFANEPRVRFMVSRGELLYLDVYDLTLRFTHGDVVNYAGGVGGITIPINKAVAQFDGARRADLTCMGHWHQLTWASRVIVNGSLIGHSPYSTHIKAGYEAPRQAFFLIDSRRGVCQSTPIWVREDEEAPVLDPAASEAIRTRVAHGG